MLPHRRTEPPTAAGEGRVISANTDGHLSDAALVARATAGDSWAKEAIFRRHVGAISALVTRLLGRRTDEIEDVVQDAFIAVFSELSRLREPSALRPWLMQIAVRKVHRRFRRRRILRLLGFVSADETGLADLASNGATPEMRAELALLGRALGRIPAERRLTWMLRYVEGETIERIALLTECSIATVKRRLKAAQKDLGAHVKGRGAGP